MPEVTGIDKLLSIIPKKRFSSPRVYGTFQYGFSRYGTEDIYLIRSGYGDRVYGVDKYANMILLSGVYQTGRVNGKFKVYRYPFNLPGNPRTEAQQAHRQKYGQAVGAWRVLTNEQKQVYNKRAIGKGMSGWNLFYKEYLLSN